MAKAVERIINPVLIASMIASLMLMVAPVGPGLGGVAEAATPTDGATSDLKGRANDYTSVLIDGSGGTNRQTEMVCQNGVVTTFKSRIHFTLGGTQPAPAGSRFLVYVSPNGGADITPAGVDVSLNQGTIPTGGLAPGSYVIDITLNVSTSFSISQGGVVLAIADDVSGKRFNSKSNSLNCTEAVAPTPTNTPVPPTATAVPPTATTVPPTATNTAVPPTATRTPLPPTATNTPVPPTATNTAVPPTATATSLPPTSTFTPVPTNTLPPGVTPSATPIPSSTPIPPTATATKVPPTMTNTSVPPANTPVPPANTPIPPTNTPIPPSPTASIVPPTGTALTPTSVPPTATTVPPGSPQPTVQPSPTTQISFGKVPLQPTFVPTNPSPVPTVKPPATQVPSAPTRGPIVSVSFSQQRANAPAPAPRAASSAPVTTSAPVSIAASIAAVTPSGGVLGESVEIAPSMGIFGEPVTRDPEPESQPLGNVLGDVLGIDRLPRSGGVPPTQLIGLLGLILAGAGLALRRRGQ